MSIDWDGLKALESKADKGPWEFEDADHNQAIATRTKYVAALAGVTAETDNFQFIVALLNAFPAILAEHERDQRVIAAAEKALRYFDSTSGSAFSYDKMDTLTKAALAECDKAKE